MQSDVREQLIQSTIGLLKDSKNSGNITARQIAAAANANLAMINYYFNSKNELVHLAVGKILEDKANSLKEIYDKPISPRNKLVEFLTAMTDITLEYREITKSSISYSLLEGDMEPVHYILPIIKELFDNSKTETECKLVAFQLISGFQLIYLRSEHFSRYLGIDLMNETQRNKLIETMVDLYIK